MKKVIVSFLLAWVFSGSWAQTERPAPADTLLVSMVPAAGKYSGAVTVRLSAPNADIFYTLDGTTPSRRTIPYRSTIQISRTQTLRAVAYRDGNASPLAGATYLIDEPATALPVLCIGITPGVLFDPVNGLFMRGGNTVDSLWQKPGANFWSRREVTAHVELFETDGQRVYSSTTGVRLFGGMSRLFPQKSLALVARKQYGQARFDHPIFGDAGPKKLKFLVLRNSGSDFGKTHFRDALLTSLLDGWDIEKQAYRPAHTYINGKYWGIYNIREKVNRYFIAAHSEAHKDSLDLIEHRITRKQGTLRHYQRMLRFVEQNDLRKPEHYARLQTMMDVGNFMDYQIAQIYFDNQDAGGNIKFWRPRTPDGRWRWIMYDTDWGFGLHDPRAYRNNSLAFHTASNGPNWPNPPWSTFLLRKLLTNPEFRQQFIIRFADHLNGSFAEGRVVGHINQFYDMLAPEMPRHLRRWRLKSSEWAQEVGHMLTFARERPTHVRMHLMAKFDTGAQRPMQIATTEGGTVILNDHLKVRREGLSAVYFANTPLKMRAVADYGYRFSHWEGLGADYVPRELTLNLAEKGYAPKAVFERFSHPLIGKVMINEICPRHPKAGDWVELFNNTDKTVSLEGWVLTDMRNEFILPKVQIAPQDYIVVCRDSLGFRQVFPAAYNIVGGMNFGINRAQETLALFSQLGAAVDSISYEVPLSEEVFTLSLKLPDTDNSQPANWEIRPGNGSPNAPNPFYVESRIRHQQAEWMQIGVASGVLMLCLMLLLLRRRRVL